jgi:hypothetical protein
VRGLEHPVHHLEHVLAERSGGPQLRSAHRHVLQADAARGALVAAGHRERLPAVAAEAVQLHVPVEAVGVRDREGAAGAVDLDRVGRGRDRVEAHHERREHPRLVDQHPGDVRVGRDGDRLALAGTGADGPLGPEPARRADDRLDRAQQRHQRMDVVRAHVQQRAAAGDVVEVRLRMPALVPGRDHRGRRRDRGADQAVVDRRAGRLRAGAEHRVRRGAGEHARDGRRGEHLGALLGPHREGLLGVDALARGDRAQVHLGVRGGDREVQDGVHLRVGDQLVDGEHAHALPPLGGGLGAGAVEVRDRDQLHVGEVLEAVQVLARDDPAADHADLHRVASFVPFSPVGTVRPCCP